ncbi:MAG: hypothetical protein IJK41_06030 [Muribaculaceae bacterium]|nr:hypothetical protein [Muribaculaceae bacterium]
MEQDDQLIVFNKYSNPVDANIVKGALEAAGIPAGVIGDSFANNLWKDAIRVVVFRRDLEDAIRALYSGDLRYEDYQDDMDVMAFENMQACNRVFCELALKIHPELGGKQCRELYARARLAFDEGDLDVLNKIKDTLS